MMTELTEHEKILKEVKQTLRNHLLPVSIPPHTVSNIFYHPDTCTRINHRFITIELVNTDYGFDILGQIDLLLEKDIIEYAVCIISNKLVQSNPHKYAKATKEVAKQNKHIQLNGRLVILKEDEFEPWIEIKMEESELWKPKL